MPPDRWLKLTVRFSGAEEEATETLLALGGSAVEEAGGALVTYLPPPDDLDSLLSLVRDRLAGYSRTSDPQLSWEWQPQEEWETLWRSGLGPRRITPRLIVSPSWEDFPVGPGEIRVVLDPGMAFGTAEHATTRGCLRILDRTIKPGERLADVGSGSGILAIAAALLGADEVLALEMDEMSCETAIGNLARNRVADRVEIRRALVEGGGPLSGAPFEGIMANLQSHLILPLLQAFISSLKPRGWLILSGILGEERGQVIFGASEAGFRLVETDEEEGWWTGLFRPDSDRR